MARDLDNPTASRDDRLRGPNDDTLLGLFWWSFYESADTDAFFESLLKYITGDAIQPAHLPSASAKANFIMGRLSLGGRYILVLDGFEVMQQQGGTDYGALQSAALRDFLHDFLRALAGGGHEAFVLMTSRARCWICSMRRPAAILRSSA